METKTHWKKNLDSRYISGEDLQTSFKGLRPEMVVCVEKTKDSVAFDQKKSEDITVSALYLKEVNGNSLYKPVVLNKKNARFFIKEFNSEFIEDWIGRPVIMFAQKDSRHGYVVRFKTYVKPDLIIDSDNFKKAKLAIQKSGFTIDQVKAKYTVSTEVEKLLLDGK